MEEVESRSQESRRKTVMSEQLMEEALSPDNWHAAWKAVVANHGAPGVDGMKCEELVPMERRSERNC